MSFLQKVFGGARWPPRDQALATVQTWMFPPRMIERALEPYDRTVVVDANLVGWVDQGLRQLYTAAVLDQRVAMPSKLVDVAWHAHIASTHEYQRFCDVVFGRFLHHTPEVEMTPTALAENRTGSLRRTWEGACLYAGLDPDGPDVPALFAVDSVAGYPGAVRWTGNCGTDPCSAPPMTNCARHHLVPGAEGATSSCGGCGGFDGCGGDSGCGGGCGGD